MTRKSLIKYLGIGLGSLIAVAALYFVFISYLVSNGFRDYKEFCEHYIPMIEQYKNEYNKYPGDLGAFKKPEYYPRYAAEECGYFPENDSYVLFAPAGLIGGYFYSSKENKWHYD